MQTDPKITKKTNGFDCIFALLGYAWVKAASKMLMKLTPDPSPRIGTDTEIFVNGTEVFPAYTVFGEPCKGIYI